MYPRYRDADRQTKGRLLDEMETMTGLYRKHLVQLLKPGALERKPRQRQRGRTYDHTLLRDQLFELRLASQPSDRALIS